MRTLIKFLLAFAVTLFITINLNAQQRPIQSLYMFDLSLVNPAYVGRDVQVSSTLINRNQWINIDGAPKTTTLTANSSFFKNVIGVGFLVANDNIGVHNDFNFYGMFSYRLRLARYHYLSSGIQAGFNNLNTNYDLVTKKNPGDANLNGYYSTFKPNIGVGFHYTFKSFYAGFSIPYIVNNEVINLENTDSRIKQKRYYYLMAGNTFEVSPIVKIKPSVLMRVQEGAPFSFDLNGSVFLYDVVGLGLSMRTIDGFVTMFELKLSENFHFGYAYDITTSALGKYSNGSHEFMLNYRFKILKAHQGTPCPTYFH